MPYTWIITKSQPHADSVVIQLRRQGLAALAIPCIEHRWHDWPEMQRMGAGGPAALFVTSRACAARIDVPQGVPVAALAPTTAATLESRGVRVALAVHGGVRELAAAVCAWSGLPPGAEVFYPTSDAALRQPEHLAAVAALATRFEVHTHAVYSTTAPDNLAQELGAARSAGSPPPGYVFWSPSAIDGFAAAGGFGLPPGPAVMVGGSTLRRFGEVAPDAWRHVHRHAAESPLEWTLRFLERGTPR